MCKTKFKQTFFVIQRDIFLLCKRIYQQNACSSHMYSQRESNFTSIAYVITSARRIQIQFLIIYFTLYPISYLYNVCVTLSIAANYTIADARVYLHECAYSLQRSYYRSVYIYIYAAQFCRERALFICIYVIKTSFMCFYALRKLNKANMLHTHASLFVEAQITIVKVYNT